MTTLAQRFTEAFTRHGLLTDRDGTPVSVTWGPAAGISVAVNGNWREPYYDALSGASSKPAFEAARADVPDATPTDVVIRGDEVYFVVGVHPDGKGFVVLELEQQPRP